MTADSPSSGSGTLEDAVWEYVWPFVSGKAEPVPRGEPTVHRRRADGRVVAEFGTPPHRIFAKLYPDTTAGRTVYEIHRGLVARGFGPESLHRVPEPLAYLEEHGLLVLRASPGVCLAGLEAVERESFDEGVARAAGWLASLHASTARVGPTENRTEGALRLARRATKAVASWPGLEGAIRDAFALLALRSSDASLPGSRVQTHGRFHTGHVFVAPECVTAIDLDRAAVADPAKDVGEFLHGLRWIAFDRSLGEPAADRAWERFLTEYVRVGRAELSALPYYLSYSFVWTLLGLAFKNRPTRRGWAERVEFLQIELEQVPRRVADWH